MYQKTDCALAQCKLLSTIGQYQLGDFPAAECWVRPQQCGWCRALCVRSWPGAAVHSAARQRGEGYWGWVSDAYRGAFEEICSTFLSPSMWKNKSQALPCHHGIRPMEDLCQMLVLKSSHITESWSSYRLCRAACFFTVWEPECMCCLMWRSTPCPSGVGELVLLPVIHSE